MTEDEPLSNDNPPRLIKGIMSGFRAIFIYSTAFALAGGLWLTSTTRLQWHIPNFDTEDTKEQSAIDSHAEKDTPSLTIQLARVESPTELLPEPSITAVSVAKVKSEPVTIQLANNKPAPLPAPIALPVTPVKLPPPLRKLTREDIPEIPEAKIMPAPVVTAALPKARPQPKLALLYQIEGVVISQLEGSLGMTMSDDGLPMFYESVLGPEVKETHPGLSQREVRKNFGYDQQDIFTGKASGGAYVLHCQKSGQKLIRAMCWRELQTSGDMRIQYRFPRSKLKEWKVIEAQVLAAIG